MRKTCTSVALALLASTSAAFAAGHEGATACLITKTDINPFFVKMREGAAAKAEELGMELQAYAGEVDGDHEAQVDAIETCIAAGAKGILINQGLSEQDAYRKMQKLAMDKRKTLKEVADAILLMEG